MGQRNIGRETKRQVGGRGGAEGMHRPLPPDQLMLATKCGHCGRVFTNPSTAAEHIPVCPVLMRKGL